MMAGDCKRKKTSICVAKLASISGQRLPCTRGTVINTLPRPMKSPLKSRINLAGIMKKTESSSPILISKRAGELRGTIGNPDKVIVKSLPLIWSGAFFRMRINHP